MGFSAVSRFWQTATCPRVRCHVHLQTTVWTGPPEPRQRMQWQRERAEKKTKQQHSWERLRDVRKLPVMWAGFISRPEPGSGAEAEAPLG